MDTIAQLRKTRHKLLDLGYAEKDVETAFNSIRHDHLKYYDLRKKIESCTACPLSKDCQPVAGAQFASSKVMVIGTAPTKEDVELGIPFAGVDGYILTIILEKLKVNRDQLYVTNVVKCKKDNITIDDAEGCLHHLYNEIALIEPEVIVTLGQVPAQLLLKSEDSLLEVRGTWTQEAHTPLHIPVMPTHHPSYLTTLTGKQLNKAKKEIWADLQSAFKKAQLI